MVVAPACLAQGLPPGPRLRVSPQQQQAADPAVAVLVSLRGASAAGEDRKAPDPMQGLRRNHGHHRNTDQADARTETAASADMTAAPRDARR